MRTRISAPVWCTVGLAASPFLATGLRGQCVTDSTAAITGTVSYESTEEVVSGGTVLVTWADGSRSATTDEDGWYRLCGLPIEVSLVIVASTDFALGPAQQLALPSAQRFEMSLVVPEPADSGPDTGAGGDVVGRVVDRDTGDPVVDALIVSSASRERTRTGPDGTFRLSGLTRGLHVLTVRHIGFEGGSAEVTVRPDTVVAVEMRVDTRIIGVAPITVTVEGLKDLRLERLGFYERREWGERTGNGRYATADDISRRLPQRMSHFIADFPGMDMSCSGSSTRGCVLRVVGTTACGRADVYIDGVRVLGDDRGDRWTYLDDFILPTEVAGVEVYTGAASVPAEFSSFGGRCGAVVIWTK
ncbi:MAG: carboxypeptidase regulatory-like domain-containing protein [Gemmatimonadota bacterium]|nr:carboxypeptidase regulatory-like domain-containing protein [Gemmatimonadota bacterium]